MRRTSQTLEPLGRLVNMVTLVDSPWTPIEHRPATSYKTPRLPEGDDPPESRVSL